MFTLTIETDNDAFGDEKATEVARILRETAAYIDLGYSQKSIKDFNGNTVGRYDLI